MIYHPPGEQLPTPEQVFVGPLQSSEYHAGSSEHKVELDMQRNDDGCLLSDHIEAPLVEATAGGGQFKTNRIVNDTAAAFGMR